MEVEKGKLDHEIVELFFKEFEESDFDWNVSKGPVELDINMENLKSNKYKDFLFNDQLLQLDKLLQEFELGKNGENKGKTRTKNIGVIGDRGTGKTSYLKTIKNLLDSDSGYYTFDIVDPNILGSSISILEILVSLIYKEVNNHIDIDDNFTVQFQARIMRNLKDISSTLSNLRKKDAYFKENNPSIDVLEDITTRIEFNKRFNELLEDFKFFIDKTKNKQVKEFVLIIDDLDLIKNHEVYSMLNDIQNFLTGNLVLVIAYRDEQLVDSVLDQKIIENQRLLESNHFGEEELQKQSINMIDKLIPYNNRIYLEDDSAELSLYHLLQNLVLNESRLGENLKDLTVDDFFKEAILYKTNLPVIPIDSSEKTAYIFPKNLRGQLQLFELLVKEMACEPEDDDWVSFYKKNLSIYKSYFYDKFTNILNMERQSSINNWLDKETRSRNGYMYKYIYNLISDKGEEGNYIGEEDYNKIRSIARMEDYNTCLGDVYNILEIYKTFYCKTSEDYYYIYTIKMVYSIELLDYLLSSLLAAKEGNSSKKDICMEKYLDLINAKIMPNNRIYYDGEFYLGYYQEYKNVFRKLHYTDFARNSDIYKNIQKAYKEEWNKFNQFRYREIFNYKDPGSTINQNKLQDFSIYPADPLAFLSKDFYLEDFIEDHISYDSANEVERLLEIQDKILKKYLILKELYQKYDDNKLSLIDYVEELEDDITDKKFNLEKLNFNVEDIESSLKTKENEFKIQEDIKNSLRERIERLYKEKDLKIEERERNLNAIFQEISIINLDIENLKDSKNKKIDEEDIEDISEYNREIDLKKEELLKEKNKRLNEKSIIEISINNEIGLLEKEIEELELKLDGKTEYLLDIVNDLKKYEKEISSKKSKIERLEEEIDKQNKKIIEKNEEIKDKEKKYSGLMQTISEIEFKFNPRSLDLDIKFEDFKDPDRIRDELYSFYRLDDLIVSEDHILIGLKKDFYIFYSIFDIDILNMIGYAPQKKRETKLSNVIDSIINKINGFFASAGTRVSVPLEVEVQKAMMKRSFKTGELIEGKSGYIKPYSDYEKDIIRELVSVDLKSNFIYEEKKSELESKIKSYLSRNNKYYNDVRPEIEENRNNIEEIFSGSPAEEKIEVVGSLKNDLLENLDKLDSKDEDSNRLEINLSGIKNILKNYDLDSKVVEKLRGSDDYSGKTRYNAYQLDLVENLDRLEIDFNSKRIIVDRMYKINNNIGKGRSAPDAGERDELAYLYSIIFLILAGQEDDL